MQNVGKTKLQELQTIMSKMPLDVCCTTVRPEFGLRWRDVAKAVRNARLPMTPSSIARVVCKAVVRNLAAEEIEYILTRLRLKLVAVQKRLWHVITLIEPIYEEPIKPADLQESLLMALTGARNDRNISSEVQTVQLGDLVFASIQLTTDKRSSAPLFLAAPPGQAVALTSSVRTRKLLQTCVEGLGYKTYEDANLHGYDITSLLRMHAGWDQNRNHMAEALDYYPVPVITKTGIDYTNRTYDEKYIDTILGPNPPLLSELTINTSMVCHDSTILDKPMKFRLQLKSDDIVKTLKVLAAKGALAPTSKFFEVINKLKSNDIDLVKDD